MKKFFKVLIISTLVLIAISSGIIAIVFLTPPSIEFNTEKLIKADNSTIIYDEKNKEIECYNLNASSAKIEELQSHTKNAFVAIEDKRFYSHNGIDYRRIIGASIKNLKHLSYKQGASTISQQLIKNTMLTSEKTLSRKINEIKLAKILENRFSKEQILEMYLNSIYFGENCYGIEQASSLYFSKQAKELTIEESATLAGIINAPSKLNPINHYDDCIKRRNLVLDKMAEFNPAESKNIISLKNKDISLNYNSSYVTDKNYIKCVLTEFDLLKNDKPYTFKNCKIYTSYDDTAQKILLDNKPELESDYQAMAVDNSTRLIKAYCSTCGEIERSPASTAKPFLVYAPAFEEKILTSQSFINDEKENFNGYSPKNFGDKYYGQVTAEKAISKSLNVPAVKTLNNLGTDKAKNYAEKLDITINSNNLGIALGSFDNGIKLKTLLGAYAVFPNYGNFTPVSFISKITDSNGKILFAKNNETRKVFSDGTASIINDCLSKTVKEGTAKTLADLPFETYSKTGTNGDVSGNLDAYSITYTSSETFGVWLGNADNTKLSNRVTGSTHPTISMRAILNDYYKASKPTPLQKKGVEEVYIDTFLQESSKQIMLASENTPLKHLKPAYFLVGTAPTKTSELFTNPKISEYNLNFDGSTVKITYNLNSLQSVIITKKVNGKEQEVFIGAKNYEEIPSEKAIIEYYLTPCIEGKNGKVLGEKIKLPQINTTCDSKNNSKIIIPTPNEWWKD